MRFSTAFEWLDWIASLHTTEMDLGLDRVRIVAERLGVLTPSCPVIIVGGTNGKGSTVAGLESVYRAAGYRTGAFTTPFLFKYNEQVRINGRSTSDEAFCEVFQKVADAINEVTLTPFEFMTLSALLLFEAASLDVWILEVGLGGRLDAVNILDADVSVVTSIGIDHVQWLGETRERIAIEKAGIFRQGRPAVCGDPSPPATLIGEARRIGASWYCLNQEYRYEENDTTWRWSDGQTQYDHLPRTTLATQNMAIVLMVITLLQQRGLTVHPEAIMTGLSQVSLPGRQQVIDGPVTEIYDVSHNPDAVTWLAQRLKQLPCQGKTLAVFSMLEDKDIVQSLSCISAEIDDWYTAPLLSTKRAASAVKLKEAFTAAGIKNVRIEDSIRQAYAQAKANARPGDRLVIFGSFHTIADVYHH